MRLGMTCVEQKKWAEAESVLRELLAQEPEMQDVFRNRLMLGQSLLGQKTFTEANPLLLSSFKGLKKYLKGTQANPSYQMHVRKLIEILVQQFETLKKPDEAAKWRKELQSIKTPAPANKTAGK